MYFPTMYSYRLVKTQLGVGFPFFGLKRTLQDQSLWNTELYRVYFGNAKYKVYFGNASKNIIMPVNRVYGDYKLLFNCRAGLITKTSSPN